MQKYKNLLEEKRIKAIQRVQEKIPYSWTEKQLDTHFLIMSNAPRIRHNKKIIRYSIFENNNLIFNKNFILNFFKYYYKNIVNLMEVCGSTYLDFNNQKDYILDGYNKDVSFNGFNFTKESLNNSLLENKNFTPFYANINQKKGFYKIVGGRHRMQILKNTNDKISFSPLCIFWDNMPENIKCELYIPNIFLEKSLKLLDDIKIIQNKEDFSLCCISNPTTLWLIMRVFDKEVSYLIDFYQEWIQELNIISPKGILWKEIKE